MKSSTNKILTIAVVLLLVTNIALVAFMLMGKNKRNEKPPSRKSTSDMMAKELNMTEEQKKNHKLSKEEHLKKVKPLFDSIRLAKATLYSLLKDSTVSEGTIDSYCQKIGETQAAIDKLTFAHFRRIRDLFTTDQKPMFDEFIQKMMQRGKRDSTDKRK